MSRRDAGPVGVRTALLRYASGWFPMGDEDRPHDPPGWYAFDPRGLLTLDDAALARFARKLARSVRVAQRAGWRTEVDEAYDRVVAACASPRRPDDGVWLTPSVAELYGRLHAAGVGHSLELWDDEGPVAGMLAVHIGGLAACETMFHRPDRPHAGNAMLVHAFTTLRRWGVTLVDVQQPSDHLVRLGCESVPDAVARHRIAAAARGVALSGR